MKNNTMNKILIIIPIQNLSALIRDIVTQLSQVENADMLFIDDGSEDDTFEQIGEFKQAKCIRHEQFLGYGSCVQSGLKYASDMEYSFALLIDPKCKKPAQNIAAMMDNLNYGYDIVSCSRILENYDYQSADSDATEIMTALSERLKELTAYDITDPLSGVRAFNIKSISTMDLTDETHGVFLQVYIQGAHFGLDIIEIPLLSESLPFGSELALYDDCLGMFLSLMETESFLYKKDSIN